MARIYAIENFPLPVIDRLRDPGHDVLTSQEAGKADQALPDNEVLQFAVNEKLTEAGQLAQESGLDIQKLVLSSGVGLIPVQKKIAA
jgi:hypothetical protein